MTYARAELPKFLVSSAPRTHISWLCLSVRLKWNQDYVSWSKISLIQKTGLNDKIFFTWITSKGLQTLDSVPWIGPEMGFTVSEPGPSPGQVQGIALGAPTVLSLNLLHSPTWQVLVLTFRRWTRRTGRLSEGGRRHRARNWQSWAEPGWVAWSQDLCS